MPSMKAEETNERTLSYLRQQKMLASSKVMITALRKSGVFKA